VKSGRRRGVRASARPVNLTERDRDILALVGRCRYLSSRQLASEFFPSSDRCRRRLRQLYDVGLVRVTLAGSTTPNLVSLTSKGVRAVAERDPELAARLQLPGAISLSGVRHHLGVADSRFYLAALCAARGDELQRWSNNGGALGRELGLPRWGLEPDGLAELRVPGGLWRLAIEVDCGTETRRVLAGKFRRYAEVVEAELVLGELWVVVDAGETRLGLVSELLEGAGLAELTRVMPLPHCQARPVRPPLRRLAQIGRNRPNSGREGTANSQPNQGLGRNSADVVGRAVRGTDGWG